MWIDATVAGSFVTDPKQSKVADKVGFALGALRRSRQARQLAVGLVARHSRRLAEGRRRREVHRLGNQQAIRRAGRLEGRLGQRAAGHAHIALRQSRVPEGGAVRRDDAAGDRRRRSEHPAVKPVPYVGVQFVAIPEFQGIGDTVGQHLLGRACRAVHGRRSRSSSAQALTTRVMTKAGYIK